MRPCGGERPLGGMAGGGGERARGGGSGPPLPGGGGERPRLGWAAGRPGSGSGSRRAGGGDLPRPLALAPRALGAREPMGMLLGSSSGLCSGFLKATIASRGLPPPDGPRGGDGLESKEKQINVTSTQGTLHPERQSPVQVQDRMPPQAIMLHPTHAA